MIKKSTEFFFYGNYFYGFCAVALSMETALQLNISLNDFIYYLFVFTATVFYYTLAFPGEVPAGLANKRTLWYAQNRRILFFSQAVCAVISICTGIFLFYQNLQVIADFVWWQWMIIALIMLQALAYYGLTISTGKKISLRNTGWLKPFVIGFVWAGLVTIGPVFLHRYVKDESFEPLFLFWFFIKNWMFITVLGILFDIKDYATDYNEQLKTFVVRAGLRKTIYYIILPLCLLGFGSYIIFVIVHHFPVIRIVFNSIPFILLVIVARSMYKRKHILYYLAIIDGLMLVKAMCGIAGVLLSTKN